MCCAVLYRYAGKATAEDNPSGLAALVEGGDISDRGAAWSLALAIAPAVRTSMDARVIQPKSAGQNQPSGGGR